MRSILILLHTPSNAGYAIAPLESTFYKLALALSDGDASKVHFAYKHLRRGLPSVLPPEFRQYTEIDCQSSEASDHLRAQAYIRKHGIDVLFGFDQPVSSPLYKYFRRGGIRRLVSYWGAPMSSPNNWPIRMAKRARVLLNREGPDHYIFESNGMAELAVMGAGIPRNRVSVVHLGVDTDSFRPEPQEAAYVYETLGIPEHRRVFFYSGHMEPRKGVAVLMKAANYLSAHRQRDDWHLVLCGNKGTESAPYIDMLSSGARERVTFAGYRPDVPGLQRGSYAAIIASTGWDSFPRSGLEMQASGLPLIASDLIGLRESVEDGVSGFLFPVGNAEALADIMALLLDDPSRRAVLSRQARARVERAFTIQGQLASLIKVVRTACC